MSTRIPEPMNNIGCQDLLVEEYVHCGWVRKRSFINKIGRFRWPQVYMILSNGCVYYFKNEYSKSPAGKFSLYGYNTVCREQELSVKQAPCAFKIIHTHQDEFKTYFFATASEKEMKEWMKHIKGQMVMANGQKAENYYYTYRHAASINRSADDDKSLTYKDLEQNIYEDSSTFKPSTDYSLTYKVKHKDEVSDDEDISDAPPPPPKRDPLKTRPPQPLPDVKSSPEETEPPEIPKRKSPAGNHDKLEKSDSGGKADRSREHKKKSNSVDKGNKGAERSTSSKDNLLNMELQNELSSELRKKNTTVASNTKKTASDGPITVTSKRKQTLEANQAQKNASLESSASDETRGKKTTKSNSRQVEEKKTQVVDDDDEDEDDDSQAYWEAIYYTDSNKEKAQEIIRNIAEDGAFLIRNSEDGAQVLVVFAENMPRKYKINNEGDDYYLKKNGPHADSVEMLMYIYHEECLPNVTVKLTTPFKFHSKYSKIK